MKKRATKENKPKGMCFRATSEESIRNFKKKFPKYKSYTNTELRKIWNIYTDKVREKLMGGHIVKLPNAIGDLQIVKKKVSPGIDWHNTQKLWEENKEAEKERRYIRFDNSHTDDHAIEVTWSHDKSKIKNREVWAFQTNRGFRRGVMAKTLLEDPSILSNFALAENLNITRDEVYRDREN